MNKNPTNVNIPILRVEIHHANKANKKASKIDGTSASMSTDPSTIVSNMTAIPSKTGLNAWTSQSTPLSTQSANGIRGKSLSICLHLQSRFIGGIDNTVFINELIISSQCTNQCPADNNSLKSILFIDNSDWYCCC